MALQAKKCHGGDPSCTPFPLGSGHSLAYKMVGGHCCRVEGTLLAPLARPPLLPGAGRGTAEPGGPELWVLGPQGRPQGLCPWGTHTVQPCCKSTLTLWGAAVSGLAPLVGFLGRDSDCIGAELQCLPCLVFQPGDRPRDGRGVGAGRQALRLQAGPRPGPWGGRTEAASGFAARTSVAQEAIVPTVAQLGPARAGAWGW